MYNISHNYIFIQNLKKIYIDFSINFKMKYKSDSAQSQGDLNTPKT